MYTIKSTHTPWPFMTLMLVWLGLAGCATPTQTPASTTTAPRLTIVTTTTILSDLTQNVAGATADVTSLLPPGTDPHTFEPSPRDSQTLTRATVLIENGAGLEEWLAALIKNSGTKAKTVTASTGLTLREGGYGEHAVATPSAAATDGHARHERDPHLWFDVQNTIRYVENIRDGLIAADAANAATYRANADRYVGQLKELDAYIVQQVATIPPERRKLVTSHDNLGYFAARYGFEVVGAVIPSVSAEAQPSAQDLATLLDVIRKANAPAIFAEMTVNPRLVEQLARDAHVKVVTGLYTDALSEPGGPADTYLKMMRHNIDLIVQALK